MFQVSKIVGLFVLLSIAVLVFIIFVIVYLPIKSTASTDTNVFQIITTKDGSVRGKRFETSFRGISYFAFRGIPYGEAPIGDLRFKVRVTNLRHIRSLFN